MRNNQPVTQHEYQFSNDVTLMSVTDPTSRITYVNEALIEVSGLDLGELIVSATSSPIGSTRSAR